MQLRIRTHRMEMPPATRAAIERKVRLVLGRHAAGIEVARITLSPVAEESPGTRCRVRVRLRRGGERKFEGYAEDPISAAAAAASRLEHRLERDRTIHAAAAPAARRTGLR